MFGPGAYFGGAAGWRVLKKKLLGAAELVEHDDIKQNLLGQTRSG